MIRIGQKPYTPDWIADKGNSAAQGILKRAYEGEIRPVCLCSRRQPELTIKHWKDSDTYFLAKMPMTGHRHRFGCDFHGDDESGEQGLALPAKMNMNGRISIAIESALSHKAAGEAKSSPPRQSLIQSHPAPALDAERFAGRTLGNGRFSQVVPKPKV